MNILVLMLFSLILFKMHFWTAFDWIFEQLIHHPTPIKDDYLMNIKKLYKLIILKTNNSDNVPTIIINQSTSSKKCMIYSHGNSGNITTSIKYFEQLAKELNVSVIIYDYVGYGLSRKRYPSEQTCYDSLKCVIDYAIRTLKFDRSNIYLVGRSLGTGVVIDYASKYKWNTPIILFSPYKSILTILFNTKFIFNFDKYRSIKKINKIFCPIKIFHGEQDDIIDISHSVELYNLCKNKLFEPTWFKNANHENILYQVKLDEYVKIIYFRD